MDDLRGHSHELGEFEDRKGGALTGRARKWVQATHGAFWATDINRELHLATDGDTKASTKMLGRFVEEGRIER